MKKALYGVMTAALLAAGCVPPTAPFTWPDDGVTSVAPTAPRKHVAPVRADQLTAENAPTKARDLEDELESDREGPLPPPVVTPKK